MAGDLNSTVNATDPSSWSDGVTRTIVIDADTSKFEQKIWDAERIGQRFSSNLIAQFEAVAIRGKSLNEVFKSLTLSLSHMVLRAAFAPLQQGLASTFSGLFKGVLPFAKGGVLRRGTPVPFAQGGVISSPIAFPLSGGLTGIAGERGAEAIMPLARGPDGRLGVAAQAASGPPITINIATPDVAGFSRSQTQVAAMIARAAALGKRNL